MNEPTILHQHLCGLIYPALAAWSDSQGRYADRIAAARRGNVLTPDVMWFGGELPLNAADAPRVPELAV